ncbi:MAG: hypothetical protein IH591_04625, partial [Bacteroidales bacterium]|nr:hypothetical protein [Bacteroidales bacterium]
MKNLLILLIFLNYCVTVDCQDNSLPRPSGKYCAGVTYLSFVDLNRKEIFDDTNEKYREITVKAWYPSDVKSETEPYLLSTESDFAITNLQYTELYSTLKSNSSRDVPVSSNNNNYP